ncbi:hypothetical protein ACTMTI_55940 [Nonomuraea sp. H19]|uniref:hypothetical protein n=1 Tax=Nonomuraea sp. H19 TaxID=3452206 RepID=UPI003F88F02D
MKRILVALASCAAATVPAGQPAHAAAASLGMLGADVSSLRRALDLGANSSGNEWDNMAVFNWSGHLNPHVRWTP